MQRLFWIDNLRALMIILVVMVHTGVTYSGLGNWYYVENEQVGMGSTLFFALIQTFTQAYFMSLLFLISGYFSRKTLERKSPGRFLSGRFYRLGIPLLIYIFILHPLNVKMVYPDLDLVKFWAEGITRLRLFSRTGPLWFVEALLIFNILYLLLRKIPLMKQNIAISPSTGNILLLILFITSTVAFMAMWTAWRSGWLVPGSGTPHEATPSASHAFWLVLAATTSLASLFGVLSTAILGWRKEQREARAEALSRRRQELEIEKLRLELEHAKALQDPPPPGVGEAGRIKDQWAELDRRYRELTKRIAAVDKDLGQTLDSERRLVLAEHRDDLAAQRVTVAASMAQLERRLAEDELQRPSLPG